MRIMIVGLSIAAGCSTPTFVEPAATVWDEAHEPVRLSPPQGMRVTAKLPAAGVVRSGDAAVFSLRMKSPDAETTLFVRFAVLATSDSTGTIQVTFGDDTKHLEIRGAARVHVLVTDQHGEVLSESATDWIPSDTLLQGFLGPCRFGREHRGRPTEEMRRLLVALPPEEFEPLALGIYGMKHLFDIVQQNGSLGPILHDVARAPSVGSILLGLGVSLVASFEWDKSIPWRRELPIEATDAYLFPVTIEANGEVALYSSVVIAESEAPTHPSSGVVSVAGIHPEDPDTRVALQLQQLGRLELAEIARIRDEYLPDK